MLGVYGPTLSPISLHSAQRTHLKDLQPIVTQPMGTLNQILELQIFPWISNGIPSIPLKAPTQLLAIPTNDESEPFKLSKHLLPSCPQVKNLFHCDFFRLNAIPSNESYLIAIAQKQFSKAEQLCIFIPYHKDILRYFLFIKTSTYYTPRPNNLQPTTAKEISGTRLPSKLEFHS
jgi:hypothetical protein